jgi:hypothetical protein
VTKEETVYNGANILLKSLIRYFVLVHFISSRPGHGLATKREDILLIRKRLTTVRLGVMKGEKSYLGHGGNKKAQLKMTT